MEGRQLGGRYEIIQRVGGGGMAVVYKAKDILLGRYVAVKVMNPSLSNDEEYIHRFNREAKNAASLSHPNVVGVYDVGQEKNTYFLVMEFIDGPSLKELIQQRGVIPPSEAIEIAIQIGEGLAHAHQMQIVHRDIKPHNIMVAPNKRYKVTDFGIARSSGETTITQTGSVMGSVHYFSPEQARGGEIGYSSDLYSFGVMLYEMVTGRVPFDGDAAVGIALKHLQEPPPDPRHYNPNISEALCNFIWQAMEKDPGDRFASATDMIRELYQLRTSLNGEEPPLSFREKPLEAEKQDSSPEQPEVAEDIPSQASAKTSLTRVGRKKPPSLFRRYLPVIIGAVGILVLVLIGMSMFKGSFADDKPDQPSKKISVQPDLQEEKKPDDQPEEVVNQSKQSTPAFEPRQKEDQQEKPVEEFPWWEKMPKFESNEVFSNPRVHGGDGEYQVNLKANFDDHEGLENFYYNVATVDSSGQVEQVVKRQRVPIQRQSEQHVYFVISIPEEYVPVSGGVYAEVYLTEYGRSDMIRFPLEQSGH